MIESGVFTVVWQHLEPIASDEHGVVRSDHLIRRGQVVDAARPNPAVEDCVALADLCRGLDGWTRYAFALSYLIASIALLAVGIETKARVLEEITQPSAV